jgi:hypothetical protein
MSHISLPVTEEERNAIENFEKLEDEYDLQTIMEHRERKARGEVKFYSHDEIKRELGFD